MNERKPPLPSLATAFLSALILLAGCAKGTSTMNTQCSNNQDECNGTCVNVQTDQQNCGACGKTCGTGTTCQNGSCSCASGLVSCGGSCVASNVQHCGTSCTACSSAQVCVNNACSGSCPTGTMKCSDGACSANNDSAHCGNSCTVCSGGTSCVNGSCACASSNQMVCNGACTDVTTTAHCGSCTNVCGAGQSCTNGQCVGGGMAGTSGGQGGMTGGVGGNGTAGTNGGTGGMTASTRPAGCPAAPDTISDFEEGTTGITIPQGGRQGWWYTFSDPNAGPQTPARNAAGPVASAMLDASDPNNATCDKWAMHSTSSGHINYVGFGTSFNQVLPPPAATATTAKSKNVYSAATAMYDGITFKIKSGSGTAPNVWFEMATSENQPQPDGAIKTADGTAAGAAQSPSSNGTDEYNTRGKLLTNVTTSWQQVYVPFGLMAPRYLPAYTAAPCAAANVLCEAPGFNPASLLGLQFSVYDQFPKTGTTAGTYDLWVDDVAFYKGANGLATFTPAANTAKTFPQDSAVGTCTKPAGASGKFLVDAYIRWKNTFVMNGPTRVVRPENGNDTVSEGIGYGMLLSVYMGDKTLFDALYSYWTSHSAGGNASTLMTWCIPAGAGSCPASGGSATDADEDVAFALIQAGKQWGGTYAASASAMISQIYTADIDAGTNIPKGGSNYASPNPTNPSYFAPAYYRLFAAIDSGHPWNNVVAASYTALNAIAGAFGGGLVPAWCSGNCSTIASNGGVDDTRYQYDSHRVPWRIGIDACWNGSSTQAAAAKAFLLSNTNFFVGKAMNGIGRVVDIYQMGGIINSDAAPNSMSAVGSAGVGAMANAGSNANAKAFLDRAYRFILDASYTSDPASQTKGYTYFNASVGLLTAFTMSGNFNSF
jgi:endo-1,4-beta-D-glucanase Y